jgi:hypothetical protein
MKDQAQTTREAPGLRAQLARMEQLIQSELGRLSVGVGPLLDEVRAGVAALEPEAGATRLAPAEHEARHAKLLESLDGLEEVLEALQLAARSGRPAASGAARGEE